MGQKGGISCKRLFWKALGMSEGRGVQLAVAPIHKIEHWFNVVFKKAL